ncbi:MAG TPA: hypothetical protein VNT81_11200 [Vicinamibacterales bacterium]|nr:hypothetical protein [Vicinamibacterales bacterium]
MTERLPTLAPDAARGIRVLNHCHAMLAERRKRLEPRRPHPMALAAERLILVGACLVYLISVAGNVISMR